MIILAFIVVLLYVAALFLCIGDADHWTEVMGLLFIAVAFPVACALVFWAFKTVLERVVG